MSIEENKEVTRIFTKRWGEGDNTVFDELATDDFTLHILTSHGVKSDIDGVKKLNEGGHTAFPDYSMEIVDMIAEDDKVMVIGKRTGTNTGVFGGLPPTGKTVTMYRMALYRLENGKIAEGWSIDDYLGQLQQLGFQIMPPTQKAEEYRSINNGYRRE